MEFGRHPKSISIRLWVSVTALILVVLGGLSLAISLLFADFYLDEKLTELSNEAREVSNQLSLESDLATRIHLINEIDLAPDHQLVIIDQYKNVLAVKGELSFPNWKGTDANEELGFYLGGLGWFKGNVYPSDFLSAADVSEVMLGKVITIEAVPKNMNGQAMLVAAVPLGNPVDSVLVLGSSPAPFQASIDAFKRIIVYASFIAIILATFVSLIFTRQVTRPLAIMQKGASRMSRGDFQPIVGVESQDELGQLAKALNIMGENLNNYVLWLSEERNLLQSIVEGISEAVIMLDCLGEVLYMNEPAIALCQGESDEAKKRKVAILAFVRDLAMCSENDGFDNLTLGTQILQVSVATTKIGQNMKGTVAVLRDVTASLRAEKERRDFMAGVTHELRTPLHLIHGYLEAIQDGIIPQEEQTEHLDVVLDEARRLSKLVNELQDFNRLESWQILDKKDIEIRSFLQELNYRFLGRAEELGITLFIDDGEGSIHADKDRLLQVFINLIDNALRYTPSGKAVRVRFAIDEHKAQFLVEDEGEGIPEESISHIFERFYRVDKARSRKAGGMGLGLAIAKQIVEAHGGSIQVSSKLKEETCFTVSLPV